MPTVLALRCLSATYCADAGSSPMSTVARRGLGAPCATRAATEAATSSKICLATALPSSTRAVTRLIVAGARLSGQSKLLAGSVGDGPHHLAKVEASLARDPAAVLVFGSDVDCPAVELLHLRVGDADRCVHLDHPSTRDHALDRNQPNA